MPHFYFNVNDEWGEAFDDEGAELPDIEAAMLHAAAGVRSILSDSIKLGELDMRGFIVIEDENRAIVDLLPFREAMTIRD